jgi:hypothetical protein
MNQTIGGFMNKKISQKKQIPAHIRYHLNKQQKSSQSIKAYCLTNGIPVQTFYTWRKRLKKQTTVMGKIQDPVPKVSFTSLGSLNTQPQNYPLFDIRFPGGTTVNVYTGITAEELAPFLNILPTGTVSC